MTKDTRDEILRITVLLLAIGFLANTINDTALRCQVNDLQRQVDRMGATDGGSDQ